MPTRMYANVRNARSFRGESTSLSISGSSACNCSTMEPIGSSTSGNQISSGPATPASLGDHGRMEALAALAADPAGAALFFDVDGTLAPIVAQPEDARVPDATRSELRRLAARYSLVACVTGRTGDVARAIVGVPELTYVGEHGLELDPAAEAWREPIRPYRAPAT